MPTNGRNTIYMGNFQGGGRGGRDGYNKGGDRGGRPSFGGKPRFAGPKGDRGDAPMFKATCSECSKSCEVPFKPSGDKPVYCKDCFNNMREGGDDRGERRSFDRAPKRDFAPRPSFRSEDRPAYKPAGASDSSGKLLSEISTKLDRLIDAVEKLAQANKSAIRDEGIKETVAKAVASDKPKAKTVKKKK